MSVSPVMREFIMWSEGRIQIVSLALIYRILRQFLPTHNQALLWWAVTGYPTMQRNSVTIHLESAPDPT